MSTRSVPKEDAMVQTDEPIGMPLPHSAYDGMPRRGAVVDDAMVDDDGAADNDGFANLMGNGQGGFNAEQSTVNRWVQLRDVRCESCLEPLMA